MIGPGNQFPSRTSELVLVVGGTTDGSPEDGGHKTNTSAAIALELGSIPANGRESAISIEGLAKRFGNLGAVRGGSGRCHNERMQGRN